MICLCGNTVEPERVKLLEATNCSVCARKANVPRNKGIMVWDHKTAPTLQTVSESGYQQFKQDTARKGQRSILRAKAPNAGRLI